MSSLQQFDTSYSRINSGGGDVFSKNVAYHIENLEINNHPQPEPQKKQPNPRCPPASDNFVGRAQELEEMWTFFFGPGGSALQRRVFMLIGMGGCGKTQLARKFMARVYREFKNRTNLVFYVDATTSETLKASLAAIATANGVGYSSDAALAWMSDLDTEFFVYMDNADDDKMELRRNFFPNSDHARILITTRLRDAQQHYWSGRSSAIHLGALSEDEAVRLLMLTTSVNPDDSQDSTVLTLAQELYCLPLAVVQAGAAIFKAKWTFAEYLKQFRRLRTSLMDGKRDRVESKAMDDYPWHVHTTWRLSYDRLSEPTAKLLQLCAHLHHTGITEDFFELAFKGLEDEDVRNPPIPFVEEEFATQAFLESFSADGAWDGTEFRWHMQEACSLSLLSYDTANTSYSIHPLIHDCLQTVASHPSQTTFLFAASTQPSWEDQVRLTSLVPHAQRLLDGHSTHGRVASLHPTLAQSLGHCFWLAGMQRPSQQLCEAALKVLAEQCLADHEMALVIQNNLALVLFDMGHYADAEKIMRELLAKKQATLGVHHPIALTIMGSLASALRLQGRLDEAAEMERAVLDKSRTSLGADHPDTIRALANLAATLHSLGRFQEAEGMKREVLEKRRTILGANHPDTIRASANLATTHHSLGRFQEAEGMKREVLEKTRAILGPSHPDTIRALANLAATLHSLGRYQEAEEMDRKVLEKTRAILGPNHPDTIRALANLAATLHSLGRYQEAEEMDRKVLGKSRATLGANHPDTIRALATLATTLRSLGCYQEAEEIKKEVLEKRRAILAPDHPDSFHALASLAITIYCQGRYSEAEPMFREAVGGFTRVLGPNHHHTAWAQGGLEECIAGLQAEEQTPTQADRSADAPVHTENTSTPPARADSVPTPPSPEVALSPPTTAEASTSRPAKRFGGPSRALKKVKRTLHL